MGMRISFKIVHLKFALLVIAVLVGSAVRAQSGYHITNYAVADYQAGNQNWDISSDGRRMFIANNRGLLVLEGQNSTLYPLPENTIVRSVAYIEERIYTGSYEEFGYWERDRSGGYTYTSLVGLLQSVTLTNDEFWRIIEFNGNIYFQSFGILLEYDGFTIRDVMTPGSMMFLHEANGRLFAHQIRGPLMELLNGELVAIPNSGFLQNTEVKSILPHTGTSILIGTSTQGVFRYDGLTFREWSPRTTSDLTRYQLNVGTRIGDRLIFGTILKGLFVYDVGGTRLDHIHSETGMQNNTVLAVQGDERGNVWVGMDKGFDYIAFDSPVTLYRDIQNEIGSVYSASLVGKTLYVGTNQGIYSFLMGDDGALSGRTFIQGSEGQVWFLQVVDDVLYAGLNEGTFALQNNTLRRVSDVTGGYTFKRIRSQNTDIILQSTYSSLVAFRKQGGLWRKDVELDGFTAPSRFLEMDHLGNIWLGHTIKGIYQLQPNERFDSVSVVREVGRQQGLVERTNRVFTADNRILVSTSNNLYQWDAINQTMVPFNELTDVLGSSSGILNILPAGSGRYWIIKTDEVVMAEIRFGNVRQLYKMVPDMYAMKLVDDYETIVALNDSLHLFCLDDGFAILNHNRILRQDPLNPAPLINDILIWDDPSSKTRLQSDSDGLQHLPSSLQYLYLSWSPASTGGNKAYSQYRLLGYDSDWTDWTAKTDVTFLRLPFGEYTFQVRMLLENGSVTDTVSLPFRVRAPLYLTPIAMIVYVMLIVSFLVMIRLYISRRRWKQREVQLQKDNEIVRTLKEKAENDLVHLSNEKLQSEIAYKTSQLANSTMAMVRKNEMLGELQSEIDAMRTELGSRLPTKYVNRLSKLIDQEMKNETEWELFEALYDQAHGDFFKRLKSDYPSLTPSDLRLCAYLRMNLASKEIAPLLNITVRGVEERRYRLRKRMNLNTDENLSERIMTY